VAASITGERDGKKLDVVLAHAVELADGLRVEYWALGDDQDRVNCALRGRGAERLHAQLVPTRRRRGLEPVLRLGRQANSRVPAGNSRAQDAVSRR